MADYAILRTAKLKTFGNIGGSLAHNYRDINTPNADPEYTKYNSHDLKNADEVMQAIKERLPEKVRKNGVLCLEYLITASPTSDVFNDYETAMNYLNDAKKWLQKKHGSENVVSTSIHLDETTPHLVAYVVPIDDRGKLNCRHFTGGRKKLQEMQTDFARSVGKKYKLERGVEGSKAKHKTIKEYYTEINNIADTEKMLQKLPPTLEVPEPKVLENKKAYGIRVANEILRDLGKPVMVGRAVAKEYNDVKEKFKNKEKENIHLSKLTKPYREQIKGLSLLEVKRINNAMVAERQQIDREKQIKRQEEQKQAEREQSKIEKPQTRIEQPKFEVRASKSKSKGMDR